MKLMPNIDLSSHVCMWCGHTDPGVFLCLGCMLYTCRDCKLGETEEGCIHKQKNIPRGQSWHEIPSSPSDFQYLKLSLEQEIRLQDS